MPLSTYLVEEMGHARVEPAGPLVAGSWATVTVTYVAGKFGIDDTGVLKVSWRTTSDMAKPQFADPAAPNYTTVTASNGAELEVRFDRLNIRPWLNTIFVRVGRGYLQAGDTITVVLGDRRGGSPGFRLQTNVEAACPIKVHVDAFAAYDFAEVPGGPALNLVAGPPHEWRAILPTWRGVGAPFRLAVVAHDVWGNACDNAPARFRLAANLPVEGLPESLEIGPDAASAVLEGLACAAPGVLRVALLAEDGAVVATSNPLVVSPEPAAVSYWGDLHAQSGETIGMGTAESYFRYARDRAFVDVTSHQGNDLQITGPMWAEFNRLFGQFDDPGRFVVLPGYEWSGNTGMGGDRNVMFLQEGQTIRRSSHALVPDLADAANDCHTVAELYAALAGREDVLTVAHVGGRYADLTKGCAPRIERAVEVHSCWGTFEWLLHDAFALGRRIGVTCGSDDHKGRPGAAHPGASTFGAVGGLTCFLTDDLSREGIFVCLRRRKHYGTTGARVHVELAAELPPGSLVFDDDPRIGGRARPARRAGMGDVVHARGPVRLAGRVVGHAPILDVTLFDGPRPIATARPYGSAEIGRRLRLVWRGAEYRGRGRETFWDGGAELDGVRYEAARAINFLNPEKPLVATDGRTLAWRSVTTGNMAGVDLMLGARAGTLRFRSKVIDADIDVERAFAEGVIVPAGGLGREVAAFGLPDDDPPREMDFAFVAEPDPSRDTPLYIRATFADGHQAWTSPLYLVPDAP
jgi:hypothetical protein